MPYFDADWELIEPGYDPKSEVYYTGNADSPVVGRDGMDGIEELLSEFCFRDESSRQNFIGMLLTMMLRDRLGRIPAMMITGNQPQVGKTTLAEMLWTLTHDSVPRSIGFSSKESKLENDLATELNQGDRLVVFDNVKTEIKSALIERMVTGKTFGLRKFHTQDKDVEANDLMLVFTANNPDCGRDIATRCIFVEMEYEGSPNTRQFRFDPETKAIELKHQVLEELVGMVQRWVAEGKPKVESRYRFDSWYQTIAGILQVSGCDQLMQNFSDSISKTDEQKILLTELLSKYKEPLSGTGLCCSDIIRNEGHHAIWSHSTTDKGKATALGSVMSGACIDLDKELPESCSFFLDDLYLVSKKSKNKRFYYLVDEVKI